MKVIDLLNKIANGEEMPKKINYLGRIYEYNEYQEDYFNEENLIGVLDQIRLFKQLNNKVEIIEEDKDIKKLKIEHMENNPSNKYIVNEFGTKCFLTKHSKILADKINEIIDEVNKLKNN